MNYCCAKNLWDSIYIFIMNYRYLVIFFIFYPIAVLLFLLVPSSFKEHIDKKCKYEKFVYFLSGTLLYASYTKFLEPDKKPDLIRKYNSRYLLFTLGSFIGLLEPINWALNCAFDEALKYLPKDVLCIISKDVLFYFSTAFFGLLFFYAFSRVNEIFFAFIRDAVDKLRPLPDDDTADKQKESPPLKFHERIKLAMVSYVELILLYGILQFILSFYGYGLDDGCKSDDCNKWIANIWDSVYFSGITIATVGYGDLHPISGFSKFLAVYEVINGVVLIVVSFTIYVSRSISANEYRKENDGQAAKELLTEDMVDLNKNKPDVFSEAFESVGLANAITEGRKNDFVSEEEVFSVLIRAVQEHQKRNLRKTQS